MSLQHARVARTLATTASYSRNIVNLVFLGALTLVVMLMTRETALHPQVFTLPVYFGQLATNEEAVPPSTYAEESAMSSDYRLHRWDPLIKEASARFGIAESWIRTVMRMESGGRTMIAENQPIRSPVGAMGLMQLMPETYDEMRRKFGLGANADNPHDNIIAGTAYLTWLYHRYGFPNVFAAYNTGPGNLEAHLKGRKGLPAETQAYLAGIERVLSGKPLRSATARIRSAEFVTFTRPNGTLLKIDPDRISGVRAPARGEYARSVHAVLRIGRKQQGVRETVAQARAAVI